MNDLIDKIKDLAHALEIKISNVEAKEKELSAIILTNKELVKRNEQYNKELSARENNVSGVEDVIKISEESKERFKQASEMKSLNDKRSKELDSQEKQLVSKSEELQKMISLYRDKNQSLENEKVQLEKDRKEMRVKIIEELKKFK